MTPGAATLGTARDIDGPAHEGGGLIERRPGSSLAGRRQQRGHGRVALAERERRDPVMRDSRRVA